jgi:hypothetical protein
MRRHRWHSHVGSRDNPEKDRSQDPKPINLTPQAYSQRPAASDTSSFACLVISGVSASVVEFPSIFPILFAPTTVSSYLQNPVLLLFPIHRVITFFYACLLKDWYRMRHGIVYSRLLRIDDPVNSSRGFLRSVIRRWACGLVVYQTLGDCQSLASVFERFCRLDVPVDCAAILRWSPFR